MALPSKTIELIERMAERLETWAKGWGKQLLKNKPQNLRQFRASLLALSGNTSPPEFVFKMKFYVSLDSALERFDYVKEELQHYMPDMAMMVQKKHEDLISEARSIGQIVSDDPTWLKRFNKSRNLAKDLVNMLRHIVEIDMRESKSEKQKGKRRSKKKSRPIDKLFTFGPGQVLFDGRDLNVGTGAALDIAKALIENFGRVVPFQKLDEDSPEREASEKIRTAIRRLRKTTKSARIPVVIENRKAEGYLMLPSTR